MKRSLYLLLLISLVGLSGCRSAATTADTLPWVGSDPILFKDDFAHQTGGWNTHEDALSYSGYTGTGFRLWADVPNFQFWSVPGLNFKDVRVFTKATKLNGPDDNLFGILCRYQDEANYYALVIGSDGYYGIFRMLDGEQTLIDQQHLDFSEEIKRGKDENEVQAVCQGDQLELSVNGDSLLTVQDNSLGFGDVGLIVGNFSEPGVDILFEYFIVAKP